MSASDDARARVAHVAELAALTLDEAEATRLAKDFAAVLAYVEELSSVDTTGVEPTTSVLAAPPPMREDVVTTSLSNDDATSQAPRSAGDPGGRGFAVPTFVES